uniref:ADP-ribose pyrophosphatase n=1 Tax=Candidatus Aschnera chinzeii TaxID=1485666 RepID=A0AAT9G4W6_9ENTR|nr:MAG: ADP-ribose diphosphatase [Candidatus Aschnera chinzeii]
MLFKFKYNDVKIINKNTIYNGFLSFVKYYFTHKLFNGGWSKEICREVVEHNIIGAVLPYDHILDKVILVEQIRIPSLKEKITPWLLEIIAGIKENNETMEELIYREAKEEANITIQRCHYIFNYLSSPGCSNERVYLYIGKIDSKLVNHGYICGSKKEHEDIRVHVIDRKIAYQWIKDGIINNAATIISLQWLQLYYFTFTTIWN